MSKHFSSANSTSSAGLSLAELDAELVTTLPEREEMCRLGHPLRFYEPPRIQVTDITQVAIVNNFGGGDTSITQVAAVNNF